MQLADLMPLAPGDEIVATYPRGLSRRGKVRSFDGKTLTMIQTAYRHADADNTPANGLCTCGAILLRTWVRWDGHQNVYDYEPHPAGCGVGWQETPESLHHLVLSELASVTPSLVAVSR